MQEYVVNLIRTSAPDQCECTGRDPCADDDGSEPTVVEAVAVVSEVVRVLVVDDHAMFATSLAMALEKEADLTVLGTASTLAEARSWVATAPPDVLLIDHRLPDGYGVQALPELKRLAPQMRVVLMSAAVDDAALVAAIENGASGFLSKSATVEELVQAIRAAAAGEVLVSPALLARLLPRLRRDRLGLGTELTPREIEVLEVLSLGLSNSGIARELGISVNTVRNHVQNLLTKLGVHSKLEALAVAVREGIINPSGRS
jgi:DNA-binding NarL/FixJ family response regulator